LRRVLRAFDSLGFGCAGSQQLLRFAAQARDFTPDRRFEFQIVEKSCTKKLPGSGRARKEKLCCTPLGGATGLS
jgi:hypothetical protein